MWGVYSGLRLPRSASAIWVARRPSVSPVASTTYQLRSRVAEFATKVFTAKRSHASGRAAAVDDREIALDAESRDMRPSSAPSGDERDCGAHYSARRLNDAESGCPPPGAAGTGDPLGARVPMGRIRHWDAGSAELDRASPSANPVGRKRGPWGPARHPC